MIAVVGGINVAKGCDWIADVCREIDRSARNIRLVVVGSMSNSDEMERWQCLETTGPYASDRLPEILSNLTAEFVLFPSIWPETFCYVLSEIWNSGHCPVARDTGAVAERIRETGAGILLDLDLSPKQFVDNIDFIAHRCRALNGLSFSFGENLDDTSYLRAIIE